jgi:hypothetical protein
LKYSTGVSKSIKRKDRTIIPSSPGTVKEVVCAAAHDPMTGVALIASAALDICFRKLRLEFIAFQRTTYAKAVYLGCS